jgi:hypothetical protein
MGLLAGIDPDDFIFHPDRAKANPIKKHPVKLTPSVPQGNSLPNQRVAKRVKRYRQADPSPPPAITSKILMIMMVAPIVELYG